MAVRLFLSLFTSVTTVVSYTLRRFKCGRWKEGKAMTNGCGLVATLDLVRELNSVHSF